MLCHAQAINTTRRILNGRYINKNSGRWDEDHSPPALAGVSPGSDILKCTQAIYTSPGNCH